MPAPCYLLDTNMVSYLLKGTSLAADRRLNETAVGEVGISAVTEGEMRYGRAKLSPGAKLHVLISNFLVGVVALPWDSAAARDCGPLRVQLERTGQVMGGLDMMIAAHALALGAILVTNDRAFSRIRRLKIEDSTRNRHGQETFS